MDMLEKIHFAGKYAQKTTAVLTVLTVLLLLELLLFCSSPVLMARQLETIVDDIDHCTVEGYYTMKDIESKDVILITARKMNAGDEYINQENNLYEVERIEGRTAWARFKDRIELSHFSAEMVWGKIEGDAFISEAQADGEDFKIGIYHSHGAESYVPSDGSESIPEGGGILKVGEVFAERMRDNQLAVAYSSETHVPHDAGAYQRSRRTVEELLRDGSNALFDVHRDAVPAAEYKETVQEEPTVQIQLVVGRQNQNVQTNRSFAESMKRVTDDTHPGLIKGILMADGSYNQDMAPLSLLLEVGSHENTREGAERSVSLFAETVSVYFRGQEGAAALEGIGSTALRSVLWVVLITGLAVGVYMLVSTGGRDELRSKIKHFFTREFSEFRGGNKRNENEE